MSGDDTARSASGTAIRALSGGFRKPLSSVSPNRLNQQANKEPREELQSVSSINPSDDNLMMSTRHNFDEDSFLPKMRSNAQRYGRYNPPESQPCVITSAVHRHFHDLDQEQSSDEGPSVEVGRGHKRSTHNTPSKLHDSELAMNVGNSSLWEVTGTPPVERRPKPTVKKSDGIERGSLRRDAQNRATSTNYKGMEVNLSSLGRPGATVPHGKTTLQDRHRSYAQVSPKQDESYYYGGRFDESADLPTTTIKNSRLASRNAFAKGVTPVASATPKRPTAFGMPRPAPNATLDSFALPDIPNMTELVSGFRTDGTSTFSRSGKTRSKYASRRSYAPFPSYIPAESVPVPEEEKQIIASLQLLKEKLANVEQEKEEADQKLDEYEREVLRLQDEIETQKRLRRADSAFSPSDGEAGNNDKVDWKIEKTKLEASVKSLKTRIERTEQKAATAEQNVKRLTQQRDSAAEQLGAAYLTQKDLESKNEELRNDNQLHRVQLKQLQFENRHLKREREELIAQLDHSHDRHEDETQRWTRREAELKLDAMKTDHALEAENQDLRDRLDEMLAQHEEETRQFTQRESMAVRAAQKATTERQQLEEEYKQLKQELERAKAQQQAERKRWVRQEKELQARVQNNEDTIHNLQGNAPQQDVNKDLREQIAKLKQEIAGLKADHDFDTINGTAREMELEQQLRQAEAEHEQESLRWKEKESKLRARLHEIQEVNQKSRQLKELTTKSGNAVDSSRARSRSKSVGRRETRSRSGRRVSAPVRSDVNDEVSEAESTTDLSLWQNKHRKSISKSKLATAPKVADKAVDITYLTPVSTEDIRAIRKKIEEEHLAKRKRHTVTASGRPQNGAIAEAMISDAKSRKSSMKDLTKHSTNSTTAESAISDDDSLLSDSEDEASVDAARKTANPRATCSRNSRHQRRRSSAATSQAFTEMTSAFILPDITLNHRRKSQSQETRPTLTDAAKAVLSSLAPPHDPKTCTICQHLTFPSKDLKPPPIIPISQRPNLNSAEIEADATLRPTEPAVLALSRVSKALHDELVHLKMRLAAAQEEMSTLDPAVGKRKWDELHGCVAGLNEAVRLKAGQIYALFDVVEGHSGEFAMGKEVGEGMERAGKKVVLESFHDSEGRVYGRGGDGCSEVEMPWEGITDTESLRTGSVGRAS